MSGSKPPRDDDAPVLGVAEAGAAFESPTDDWSIERERLADYRRTGESLDAEDTLAAFVARVRARAARKA